MTLQVVFSYEQAQRHDVIYIACTNRKKPLRIRSSIPLPRTEHCSVLVLGEGQASYLLVGSTYKIPAQEIIYFRK